MEKMNRNVQKPGENKMGYMPVNKLLISMSLPMMISMLVQALYNIVDSIFVSQVNEYSLRAVSLAFPIQSLMIAVSVGTSVGVNAFLSKTLGEKNYEKANVIAQNGVFLAFLSSILFAVIGFTVSAPFFASQTEVQEVREYGVSYLTICCVLSIGIFLQMIYERLLQATGRTFFTMITQGVGAIVNLLLDPVLIFGWFGLPKMGVSGAALATVTGQMVAAVLAFLLNKKYNTDLRFSMRRFRPNLSLIGQIYKVGAPSIVVQSVGSVMTYGMNLILGNFGVAQTVFGVFFKLQSFVFMPVFGLNNGMVPIIAFNYGAGKKDRVIGTIKSSVVFGVAIMLLGLVAMQTIPEVLIGFFDTTGELLEIGIPALRTISISFLFAGFCIVAGSVFQALGNGMYSMIVSITRQLFVLLPVAKLLSLSGDVDLVWWAFPFAELFSVGLSAYFLFRIYREVIVHIGADAQSAT